MDLIGFTGRKGSGKDTAAQALKPPGRLVVASFADPLYSALDAMGLIDERKARTDREYKEGLIEWIGVSPRTMMQTLGTQWGRNLIHPDIWVLLAKKRAQSMRNVDYLGPGDALVYADVRFENEAAMIRAEGGVIAHIERPGIEADGHVSEDGIEIQPGDHVLFNDGTEDEFVQLVAGWYEGIRS